MSKGVVAIENMLAFYLTWSGARSPPQPQHSTNKAFIKGTIFKCLLHFSLYSFNALLAVKVFSTMVARHLHILKMTHFNVASNIFESSLFSTNLANAGEDVFSSAIAVLAWGKSRVLTRILRVFSAHSPRIFRARALRGECAENTRRIRGECAENTRRIRVSIMRTFRVFSAHSPRT